VGDDMIEVDGVFVLMSCLDPCYILSEAPLCMALSDTNS